MYSPNKKHLHHEINPGGYKESIYRSRAQKDRIAMACKYGTQGLKDIEKSQESSYKPDSQQNKTIPSQLANCIISPIKSIRGGTKNQPGSGPSDNNNSFFDEKFYPTFESNISVDSTNRSKNSIKSSITSTNRSIVLDNKQLSVFRLFKDLEKNEKSMIIITSFEEKKAKVLEEIPQIKKNEQDSIGQKILRNLAKNYDLFKVKELKKIINKKPVVLDVLRMVYSKKPSDLKEFNCKLNVNELNNPYVLIPEIGKYSNALDELTKNNKFDLESTTKLELVFQFLLQYQNIAFDSYNIKKNLYHLLDHDTYKQFPMDLIVRIVKDTKSDENIIFKLDNIITRLGLNGNSDQDNSYDDARSIKSSSTLTRSTVYKDPHSPIQEIYKTRPMDESSSDSHFYQTKKKSERKDNLSGPGCIVKERR
tara:strand:- start:313 stop:1575 length:1263 start_codon:yes stop_codon:yes gene_type:complete